MEKKEFLFLTGKIELGVVGMNKSSLTKIKCQKNEITTYEIVNTNHERRKSMKLKNKIKKTVPLIIGICSIGICFGIYSNVQGDDELPLLEQIENAYGLKVTGIEAAGGSAVDVVNEDNLTDYLPVADSRYFTSVLNVEDNTENIIEEMTLDIPNDNGGYNYNLYNYLSDTSVQGMICSSELDDYYFTQQENLLNSSNMDTDFYIGLPEKNWTLNQNNGDTTHKIFIAPEFYTVTTPHGTYEKCLLKYDHTSSSDSSWVNSNTFTVFAPYGVGKVYSVTFSENSSETPLTYYTYADTQQDVPDDQMIISDIMNDETTDLWTNSDGVSDLMFAMRLENGDTRVYLFGTQDMEILYAGMVGKTTADEINIIGDSGYSNGKIVYFSENELELTIGNEVYTFHSL